MSKAIGDRGLREYLAIKDSHGSTFRVQSSSAATEAAVWIFTDQVTGRHLGHDMHAALHLRAGQVRQLRAALLEWLKDNVDIEELE